jgi:hypothetical protein
MSTYTFVIGSMDDFNFLEDLMDYVDQEGADGNLNYSVFDFDEPAEIPEDTALMIGRGMAFSDGWSLDDSFSFMVKGTLDEDSLSGSGEVQNHDLWEIK